MYIINEQILQNTKALTWKQLIPKKLEGDNKSNETETYATMELYNQRLDFKKKMYKSRSELWSLCEPVNNTTK